MRRRAAIFSIAATVLVLAQGVAEAAVHFSPCGGRVECGRLTVPLDRSGQVAGTVSLHVERVRARKSASAPPVVALIGGPGKPDTHYTRDYLELFGRALDHRDLVVFDPRGTGGSDAIHCAGIESGQAAEQAFPACAAQLGGAANHYTTVEDADDVDSVRAALGYDRVTLFARAYGAWEGQVFARRHPQRVASLVFDSTIGPTAIGDGFNTHIFRNLPSAVRHYCARHSCRGLTKDLWTDGVKLYRRLVKKPLKARYFDGRGRRRTMEIGAIAFALLVYNSYPHAEQRAELPRAIAAALRGDGALLARLLAIDAGAPRDPKRSQNDTVNRIKQCEEVDFHFDRSASPPARLDQAHAALARIPASAFAPFGPDLAFLNSLTPLCAYWPMLAARPNFGGPLPDVPALLFHGEEDLATTPGETTEVARALPRSRVLTVPQTAYATWITDVTGCVRRGARAFLTGHAVRSCRPTSRNPYAPRRLPPRSVHALHGRLLRAVAATIADGFNQLDDAARRVTSARRRARIGGLRGGFLRGGRNGPQFVRYQYVRGLAVSGRVTRRGAVRLRVTGKVRGALRFAASGRVRGRLGGRRIRATLRLVRETPYEALRLRGLLPG